MPPNPCTPCVCNTTQATVPEATVPDAITQILNLKELNRDPNETEQKDLNKLLEGITDEELEILNQNGYYYDKYGFDKNKETVLKGWNAVHYATEDTWKATLANWKKICPDESLWHDGEAGRARGDVKRQKNNPKMMATKIQELQKRTDWTCLDDPNKNNDVNYDLHGGSGKKTTGKIQIKRRKRIKKKKTLKKKTLKKKSMRVKRRRSMRLNTH